MLVAAFKRVASVTLDTHIMIENPDKYIDVFLDAGTDVLTFHVEASHDVTRDLRTIRDGGKKSGLAEVDLLLSMSVYPGFGGQSFIPAVLAHIEAAANYREAHGLHFAIEIDGGINPETAVRARGAGVDILVAGTAIFGQPDYATAIAAIRG